MLPPLVSSSPVQRPDSHRMIYRAHPYRALLAVLWLVPGLAACSLPRWPVEAPVTSPFGFRLMGWRPDIHRGVDLDVPTGTEVRAMTDGSVRYARTMSGYGNVIWLEHGSGVLTIYAHLSGIAVAEGESVSGGEVIGLSGASGDVTGPHLHFEVWRWGRQVDPVPLLGGRPGR
jgi:murein DD-endopeptidase MepM/ murein hydrolase activator NlpD